LPSFPTGQSKGSPANPIVCHKKLHIYIVYQGWQVSANTGLNLGLNWFIPSWQKQVFGWFSPNKLQQPQQQDKQLRYVNGIVPLNAVKLVILLTYLFELY